MSGRPGRKVAGQQARLAYEARTRAAAAKRRRRAVTAALTAAIAVAVLAVGISSGSGSTTAAPGGQLSGAAFSASLFAGIPQHGLVLGRVDAPVRMVEFADLQCPYCDEYALQGLPTLVRDYVRTGELSLRFENLSFIGSDSVVAGRAAAAAALQNRLWNFVDLMYLNQGQENTGYVTAAYVRRLFDAVPGLNVAAALRASRAPSAQAALERASAYATSVGVEATPSFLIGTRAGILQPLQPSTLTPGPFVAAVGALLEQVP